MKKFKSITGLVLVVLFLVLIVSLYYSSRGCEEFECLVMLIPTLPWYLLVQDAMSNNFNENIFYTVCVMSVLLNAIILYLIGVGVENLFNQMRRRIKNLRNTARK